MNSTNKFHIFLLVLSVSFAFSEAFGEPKVELKKFYYKVQGETAEAIRMSLNRNSPVVVNNRRFDAYTRWYVSWKIWYILTENSCTISKITSRLEISHTLPKLSSAVSSDLFRKWQKYYHALLDHEKGHGDLAVQAAFEIERKISNLPPQKQCATLEKKANKLGKSVIRKYVALEKKYDRETRHGAARGAAFP